MRCWLHTLVREYRWLEEDPRWSSGRVCAQLRGLGWQHVLYSRFGREVTHTQHTHIFTHIHSLAFTHIHSLTFIHSHSLTMGLGGGTHTHAHIHSHSLTRFLSARGWEVAHTRHTHTFTHIHSCCTSCQVDCRDRRNHFVPRHVCRPRRLLGTKSERCVRVCVCVCAYVYISI